MPGRFIKLMLVMGLMLGLVVIALGQKPRQATTNSFKETAAPQQPLYGDYRGVRIGMSAEETRAKLGAPALKGDDQDYYTISQNESAQIAYDAKHKVTGISVDYADGIGAPDPKAVVGGDLEMKNGSLYKLVRYESLGFWVSYNRSTGPVMIVTITIQKIMQ